LFFIEWAARTRHKNGSFLTSAALLMMGRPLEPKTKMVNLFAGLWTVVRRENVAKTLEFNHANIFETVSQI
jgi:hypothetical protein